jgi:hypothetical protein
MRAGPIGGQEHDGNGVEEGSGGFERGLRLFPESVPAVSGEEPFQDPPARRDSEPDLIGGFLTIWMVIEVAVGGRSPL